MEELIFFGVLIFFSILESVARSRKAKKAGGTSGDVPVETEGRTSYEFEWAQKSPDELPTYDADPSYDDAPSYDDQVNAGAQSSSPSDDRTPSSRTLLSGGLLEQLAGMAQKVEEERLRMERAEALKHSQHREEVEAPVATGWSSPDSDRGFDEAQERRDARDRERERAMHERQRGDTGLVRMRGPSRGLQSHAIHRSHAGYGTDPSSRARSEQDGLDPLAQYLSADASAVRRQLKKEGKASLRQAIILQEVLGPPASMREA